MKSIYSKYKSILNLAIAVASIAVLNIVANQIFFRVDLSSNKVHSLSPKTKHLLLNLEEIINVEVYLDGDFPAEIEKLKKALSEKLDEFKAYGGDNFKVNFRNLDEDPVAAKEVKNQVFNDGLDYSDILISRDNKQEVVRVWPGIILRMGDQFKAVQFLQKGKFPISQVIINHFNDQLEYNLVLGINNLLKPTTKKIKFLRGHGELDNADAWIIRDQLIKNYDVDTIRIKQLQVKYYNESIEISNFKYDSLIKNKVDSIYISKSAVPVFDEFGNPNKNAKRYITKTFQNREISKSMKDISKISEDLDVLDKTDLLLIAKPKTSFSEKELFIIDQYIMNGGKIIWMVDMLDVNESELVDTNIIFARPLKHQLQEFLFKYGARFNVNMVNDVRCAPVIREDGLGRIPNWYFYPLLYLDKPSIYLNNVGPIKTRYVCSIDTVGDDNNKKTALLKSSTEFKILRQTSVNYQNLYNYNPRNFDYDLENEIPVSGWLFEGVFKSNYENRSVSKDFKKFISNPIVNFKSKSKETKMIFIGDGDLIRNDFIKADNQIKPVLLSFESADYGTPEFFPRYGNEMFFLNLVDELLGKSELIPLRSKMNMPRLLKKEIFGQRSFWQLINILIPLILVIVIGLINQYWRKKKYA
ncbi:Gldg family protein [Flavobacteriales bacterium]|nr:Gldg family protein [Flavobacteriales bacterium]